MEVTKVKSNRRDRGITIGQCTGHLTRHKNGKSWYCTYRYKDQSGKRKQKQISLKIPITENRKKAYSAMVEYLTIMNTQTDNILDRDSTVAEVAYKWLEVHKSNVRQNTFEKYEINVRKIIEYMGNVKIVELTPAAVQDYIAYLQKKGKRNQKTGKREPMEPNSVKDTKMCLGMVCTYAIHNQIIKVNPCDSIKVRKTTSNVNDVKYMDYNTAKNFIDFIPDDHELKDIIVAAINFGLRRSELLGLRNEDVDLETGKLIVRNTVTQTTNIHVERNVKSASSYRTIPLVSQEVDFFKKIYSKKEEMRRHLGKAYIESDYVFTREDGSPFQPSSIYRRSKRLLVNYGEPDLTFHSFRHTYASILHARGVDLLTAQRLLGHSDPTITLKIYTHNNRQAIEAQPIGLIEGGYNNENIRKNTIN